MRILTILLIVLLATPCIAEDWMDSCIRDLEVMQEQANKEDAAKANEGAIRAVERIEHLWKTFGVSRVSLVNIKIEKGTISHAATYDAKRYSVYVKLQKMQELIDSQISKGD